MNKKEFSLSKHSRILYFLKNRLSPSYMYIFTSIFFSSRYTNLLGDATAFSYCSVSYRQQYNARTWCGCIGRDPIKWSVICWLYIRVYVEYILVKQIRVTRTSVVSRMKKWLGEKNVRINSLILYIFSMTSLACISITTIALNFSRSSLLRSPRIVSEYLSNVWFCFFLSLRNGFFESAILGYEGKSNKA